MENCLKAPQRTLLEQKNIKEKSPIDPPQWPHPHGRFVRGRQSQADLHLIFLSVPVRLIFGSHLKKKGDEINMRHASECLAQDVGILLSWEMNGGGECS